MSFEFDSTFSFKKLNILKQKTDILNLNEKSMEYGLFLNESDVEMLVQVGKDTVSIQDRLEFGESATVKIIEKFMKSTYISQTDYADALAALIDIFYNAKEESLDLLTDDEIIDIMYNFFENESGGSLDVLQGRDMDYLCRKIRNIANGIMDDENVDEDNYDE